MLSKLKFRIWDTESRSWFVPSYNRNTGEAREMFITQNGEVVLHERDRDGKSVITALPEIGDQPRYRITQYTSIRDKEGERLFLGDWVKDHRGGVGVLVFEADRLCVASGPVNNYHAWDSVSERELREHYTRVGNIYESPEFPGQEC